MKLIIPLHKRESGSEKVKKTHFTPPPALRHCGFLKKALFNNKGLGLIEVLVMSTIGVLVISGSAEFLKVVLSSAKVSNSILTENDFKQTIARGLSIDCAEATPEIRPDNLEGSDKNNGIGDFKSDFTLPGDIKIGTFKGSIEVVKMDLTGDSSKPTRDFNIYYKKVGLERASAPDSQNCMAKNGGTPAKTAGCFKHTCTVGIESSNKSCNSVVNCHNFSKAIITDITNKVSEKITETIKEKDCPAPTGDDPQQFLKGFDDSGNPECESPQAPATLPAVLCPNPGEFLKGFDSEGNPDCQSPCYGGQIYIESIDLETPAYTISTVRYEVGNPFQLYPGETPLPETRKRFCECPAGLRWNGIKCITCPDGQRWINSEKACMSCNGGQWVNYSDTSSISCRCPSGKRKKKVG